MPYACARRLPGKAGMPNSMQSPISSWDLAMGPLATALANLFPSSEQPPVVTLIPTGLLALLPLHAAWTKNGDAVAISSTTSPYAMRRPPLPCVTAAHASKG